MSDFLLPSLNEYWLSFVLASSDTCSSVWYFWGLILSFSRVGLEPAFLQESFSPIWKAWPFWTLLNTPFRLDIFQLFFIYSLVDFHPICVNLKIQHTLNRPDANFWNSFSSQLHFLQNSSLELPTSLASLNSFFVSPTQWDCHDLLVIFSALQFRMCFQKENQDNYMGMVHLICFPSLRNHSSVLPVI